MNGQRQSVVLSLLILLMVASTGKSGVMYWADGGNLYRAGQDGTDKAILFAVDSPVGDVRYVDIDTANRRLYFAAIVYPDNPHYQPGDTPTYKFWSCDMDGQNPELLPGVPGVGLIYGFTVDSVNQRLYWGGGNMHRINLDGAGLMELPPYWPNNPYYPHDMEIDTVNSKFYYSDAVSFNGIKRAELDGTGVESLFNWGWSDSESTHIALDVASNLIYFTRYESNTIGVANLDGSDMKILVYGIDAFDIEIDKAAGKLYWTTETKIQRANLNGTEIEDVLLLDNGGPWSAESLALDLSPVPEPTSLVVWSGLGIMGLVSMRRRRMLNEAGTDVPIASDRLKIANTVKGTKV